MTAVPDLVFLIVESELGKNSPTKWIQNYWLRSPFPATMGYFRLEPNQIKRPAPQITESFGEMSYRVCRHREFHNSYLLTLAF